MTSWGYPVTPWATTPSRRHNDRLAPDLRALGAEDARKLYRQLLQSAPANPSNTNPGAPVDPQDAGIVYAQCVRDNGYPEMPDPGPDGQIVLHGSGGHDRYDPRLRAAQEACSDLRPPGTEHQDLGDPEYAERMLAFAQCMRENGVPEFPDPGPDGRLSLGHGESRIDRNDPRLQAAMQACYKTVPGVAH